MKLIALGVNAAFSRGKYEDVVYFSDIQAILESGLKKAYILTTSLSALAGKTFYRIHRITYGG